jgi:hypothetical protein
VRPLFSPFRSRAPLGNRSPVEAISVPANEAFFEMKQLLLVVLISLGLSIPSFAGTFTVSGQGIPSSAASPTSDQGKALTTSLQLTTLVIANTSASSQTVTVNDCQGTPFYLFKAAPIPAGTTWIVNATAIPFAGCLQWSASSTAVMGTIVGAQ